MGKIAGSMREDSFFKVKLSELPCISPPGLGTAICFVSRADKKVECVRSVMEEEGLVREFS